MSRFCSARSYASASTLEAGTQYSPSEVRTKEYAPSRFTTCAVVLIASVYWSWRREIASASNDSASVQLPAFEFHRCLMIRGAWWALATTARARMSAAVPYRTGRRRFRSFTGLRSHGSPLDARLEWDDVGVLSMVN